VDLQLYAIIAVIIKDFVYSWYAKTTPDHVFVDEVVQIVTHCTRALEQRFRKVDFESLLVDEIPELVDAHVTGEGYCNASVMLVSNGVIRSLSYCTSSCPSTIGL